MGFFDEIGPREAFRSNRFMELLLDFAIDMTDRKASERLNRVRLETKGISPTTFRNTVEREGLSIQENMEEQCATTLEGNGIIISESGELQTNTDFIVEERKHIPKEVVQAAADKLEIKEFDPTDYESTEKTVNISADDVCVNRQTECRPRSKNPKEQHKRVNNTIIHIEKGDGRFIINSGTVIGAFKLLFSFLMLNNLLGIRLVFFVDGARSLNTAITNMFKKLNFKVLIDWYHLEKKFLQQLSMALKGSKIRNAFMDKLRPILWLGKVDKAIKLLQEIEPEKVKDQDKIDKLVKYLERVRDYIPCYALRKELGLRNSSNAVEKANDIVVAKRQKRNGMSWSDDGSVAFASVTAVKCNGQLSSWVGSHSISFSFNNTKAA